MADAAGGRAGGTRMARNPGNQDGAVTKETSGGGQAQVPKTVTAESS